MLNRYLKFFVINRILIVCVAILLFASCKKDNPLDVIVPKEYLPAYPGSYWDYTNGERISVHTEYVVHSYGESINSPSKSTEKLVPKIGNEYLYEYKITQNSIVYPLKQLLTETVSSSWIVNELNGENYYRKTIEIIDTMYIKLPSDNDALDSVLYLNTLVVVEYTDSMTVEKWNTKEYYSKNVGLIRSEVNNPYDNIDPVVQKQLIYYYISK